MSCELSAPTDVRISITDPNGEMHVSEILGAAEVVVVVRQDDTIRVASYCCRTCQAELLMAAATRSAMDLMGLG